MPPLEIEKKFLVRASALPSLGSGTRMAQGYLASTATSVLRVRRSGDRAWLTLKGPPRGDVRDEFEFAIDAAHAQTLLQEWCHEGVLGKVRHRLQHAGWHWEVDVFDAPNQGLIVAEIETTSLEELSRAVAQRPAWVGREVSDDPRLTNAALARRPLQCWPETERLALLAELA